MTHYGIIEDHDYNQTHKRKRLTLWSGPFASVLEGEALSLPKGDGYMVTTYHGEKVRVSCPVERTSANYMEQDKAFNDALNAHYGETVAARLEYLRSQINAERISTGELIELQGMADQIDPGDVQLLEWAGVPEFPEDEEQPFKHNGKRILNRR